MTPTMPDRRPTPDPSMSHNPGACHVSMAHSEQIEILWCPCGRRTIPPDRLVCELCRREA